MCVTVEANFSKEGPWGVCYSTRNATATPQPSPQPRDLILPAMDLSLAALEAAARCWRPACRCASACGATSTPMTSDGAVLFGDASLIDRSGENAAARSRAIADAGWKESRPPTKRPSFSKRRGSRRMCHVDGSRRDARTEQRCATPRPVAAPALTRARTPPLPRRDDDTKCRPSLMAVWHTMPLPLQID